MSEPPSSSLGAQVHRLRQRASLTTRQLAAASGIDQSVISRLERGLIKRPSPDTLQRLSRALDADLAQLYKAAGYVGKASLPAFRPYLRAKYGHLPPDRLRELTAYFERIEKEYGGGGSAPKEGSRANATK